jgi:tetratricopeptide (TPR) repeat protein
VLVRPDGSVVIVDFGLAERFALEESREHLSLSAGVAGTLLYMAPEQLTGQPTDARADLYAVGCILYELFTGAPPHAGLSPGEIIRARLEHEIPPPSERVPDLPIELEVLVLRLLARSPRARLGYADDLARMLEALGADPLPPGRAVRPRAYLYRPGLAGRREALEALEHELAGTSAGRGGLVLLGGESGVGKTRLAVELVRTHRAALATLEGRCTPSGGDRRSSAPLEAFRHTLQTVADRCRARGPAETARLLGFRAPLLARYEPSLAGLPGLDAWPEPADLPVDAARLRLFSWLGDVLEALSADSPTLLVLDDLHWADELSIGALEHLALSRRLEHRPLLVLGTYRSEEVSAPLGRVLELPGVRRVELSRLEETAIGAMAADMPAMPQVPQSFVRFLTRTSEGNPLFAAEYLHAAVAEGILYRDEGGRWSLLRSANSHAGTESYDRLALPRSLRALIGRRLEGLSAGAQALLEAAAVLGRELDGPLLAEVAAASPPAAPPHAAPPHAESPHAASPQAAPPHAAPPQGAASRHAVGLLEATRELLTRQVLEESGPAGLRFVHDKLREVAYDRIEAAGRVRLHRRSAGAIERRVSADAGARDSRLAELGRHWEGAGERARARDCYLEAARRAVPRHALAEAEGLYRAWLALADGPDTVRVAARRELARQVLCEQGKLREALEESREALSDARAVGDAAGEAGALGDLAYLSSNVGELDAALEAGHAALDRLRRLGDRRATADVPGSLAHVALIRGRREEALPLCEEAAALSRLEGDSEAEAIDLCDLAVVHHALGQLEEVERHCRRGLEIARSGGHPAAEAKLLTTLAGVAWSSGDLPAARAPLLEALAVFREMGDRNWEGRVLRNLGAIAMKRGDLGEARQCCEEALAIHRATGDRRWEGVSLQKLAEIMVQLGQLERAGGLIREAIDRLHEAGDRKLEAQAIALLAGLELDAGRAREARRGYETAVAMLREAGEQARLNELLPRLAEAVRQAGGTPFRR